MTAADNIYIILSDGTKEQQQYIDLVGQPSSYLVLSPVEEKPKPTPPPQNPIFDVYRQPVLTSPIGYF